MARTIVLDKVAGKLNESGAVILSIEDVAACGKKIALKHDDARQLLFSTGYSLGNPST